MRASPFCVDKDSEVLVRTEDLEEHESDHEEWVSIPSADSEAGHEGEVCNLVNDVIWVEKVVLALSGSCDVDDDDSGRRGAHGGDIRNCGAEPIPLGYPYLDSSSGGLHRVRTWLE